MKKVREFAERFAAAEKTLEAFEELSGTFDPEGTRGRLAERDFWDVALSDEEYPQRLWETSYPPARASWAAPSPSRRPSRWPGAQASVTGLEARNPNARISEIIRSWSVRSVIVGTPVVGGDLSSSF